MEQREKSIKKGTRSVECANLCQPFRGAGNTGFANSLGPVCGKFRAGREFGLCSEESLTRRLQEFSMPKPWNWLKIILSLDEFGLQSQASIWTDRVLEKNMRGMTGQTSAPICGKGSIYRFSRFFFCFGWMAFQAIFFRCQSFYLVIFCLFPRSSAPVRCRDIAGADLALNLNVRYRT